MTKNGTFNQIINFKTEKDHVILCFFCCKPSSVPETFFTKKDIIPEPVEPGGVHPELSCQVDSQRESAVHGVIKKSPAERGQQNDLKSRPPSALGVVSLQLEKLSVLFLNPEMKDFSVGLKPIHKSRREVQRTWRGTARPPRRRRTWRPWWATSRCPGQRWSPPATPPRTAFPASLSAWTPAQRTDETAVKHFHSSQ